ncbi:MAG: riboflavin biosynthesis protein RibF [Clostridia bacterium]|nr:riboflavin biosynthesis protein RibF [Clostridia bacterium]
MTVLDFSEIRNFDPCAVALGNFEALHIGHRHIIEETVSYARENGLSSAVYMYKNNYKSACTLFSLEDRLSFLEKMGVDFVILDEFTPEYSQISCEDFVDFYIREKMNSKAVFVGFNYRFGKGESGDVALLKELCGDTYVFRVDCVKVDVECVSTTLIKSYLKNGEIKKANQMLGRDYFVRGIVASGRNVGTGLGFPTANIEVDTILAHGVYATSVLLGDEVYKAITNIGGKPSFGIESVNIETHILDAEIDLYGSEIIVLFHEKIRDIIKFDSKEELVSQLVDDKKRREIL